MTIDTATGLEAPAELSSERVRDIFSHIARKYERFNALSSFGAYKLWLAGMMRQAPIDESHDVLDIAGGTGDVTFTVARTKHPSHIQCTDLVPEMLDVARMHIDEGDGAGVPIDFEVVDARTSPTRTPPTTSSPWPTASVTCPTGPGHFPRCSAY